MFPASIGMKVISYSLFGTDPKYRSGMAANIRLALDLYPGWEVRVHHDGAAGPEVEAAAVECGNARLVDMSSCRLPGMFWRFLPFEGVDRLVVRDADSRLTRRERAAVDEWVADATRLHLMRDHPHHSYLVMGGMWGLVPDRDLSPLAEAYVGGRGLPLDARMVDMDFLRDVVYPLYCGDSTVHCSLAELSVEPHARPFPCRMEGFGFVGEIFGADGVRAYQWEVWRDRAVDELTRVAP